MIFNSINLLLPFLRFIFMVCYFLNLSLVFPGAPDCPSGQFPCVDSVGCVNASARCDGQMQCPTGFDEENCTAVRGCLDSDWSCRNHICIPKELRCNGLNDCMDSSDEDDCGEKDGQLCQLMFIFFTDISYLAVLLFFFL
uniref:Uncharacterized protein n=1 Tax=Mastacembelus armatus TaxID=205130 RepID=A0A7N8YE68_9TELE